MNKNQGINRRVFLKSVGSGLLVIPMLPGGMALAADFSVGDKACPLLGDGASMAVMPGEGAREGTANLQFVIKLGKGGLPANDSIGLVHGSLLDRWAFRFPSHWWGQENPWQATDPDQPNHLAARCSRQGVAVSLKVGAPYTKLHDNTPTHFVTAMRERTRYVLEMSADQELKAGDSITLQWSKVRMPPFAMKYFFMAFRYSLLPELDRDLPIRKGEFDTLPYVRIKGHTASALYVTCRPQQAVGSSFDLNIAAIDQYGNLAEDFEGTIELKGDPALTLPGAVIFSAKDRGHKRITGLSAARPGWYRITATRNELSGQSNYIVVSDKEPAANLYFGDMHTHTLDCDGTIDISEHFFYAPHVAGLDFGGSSCHAEYFGCQAAWQRYLKEIARANRPGEFVVFPGYEWAQQGHNNAYFLSEADTVLLFAENRMKREGNPPDEPAFRMGAASEGHFMTILRELKQPVFTIGHVHTAYTTVIDDSVHWLEEIYSCHRYGRNGRENCLRGLLARGLRLGVVAGSDMHRLTMGHLCKQPGELWPQKDGREKAQFQTAGLQATYARDLTREALYDGMKERCTYGTTGARIVLFFRCGEAAMGARVTLKEGVQPLFECDVGGTAPIEDVVLCKYADNKWTEPFKEQPVGADRCTATWQDNDFSGKGIYYVRVTQTDGEQAWSSPIWVGKQGE